MKKQFILSIIFLIASQTAWGITECNRLLNSLLKYQAQLNRENVFVKTVSGHKGAVYAVAKHSKAKTLIYEIYQLDKKDAVPQIFEIHERGVKDFDFLDVEKGHVVGVKWVEGASQIFAKNVVSKLANEFGDRDLIERISVPGHIDAIQLLTKGRSHLLAAYDSKEHKIFLIDLEKGELGFASTASRLPFMDIISPRKITLGKRVILMANRNGELLFADQKSGQQIGIFSHNLISQASN